MPCQLGKVRLQSSATLKRRLLLSCRVARAISRMQSSARLRSNDVEGAPHVPSRGGTGVLAMVTAAWDWLHTCEPRYILMGAVLLAILVLQVSLALPSIRS